MTNSKQKGKRGERDAVHMVRNHWYTPKCVRSAQVSGKFSADLLGGPPGMHIEVKTRKKIAAMRFYDQAWEDACADDPPGPNPCTFPLVLMKEDKGMWMVMFAMRDTDLFIEAVTRAFTDLQRKEQYDQANASLS